MVDDVGFLLVLDDAIDIDVDDGSLGLMPLSEKSRFIGGGVRCDKDPVPWWKKSSHFEPRSWVRS